METWSPVPGDTDAEAHEAQMVAYRRMGGAARLALAFQLTDMTRDMAKAGIRHRHPEYTDEQVQAAFRRLVLGDELHRRSCPGDEILEP
jgi:Rv0078B-related antitoxin